jgi:ArsR family transcriptional regulator
LDLVWQPTERNLEVLKAISDPVRYRILDIIGRQPMSVTELIQTLEMSKALISYHLRILRHAGVVDTERRSYYTFYKVNPLPLKALSNHLRSLIGEAAWMMPDRLKDVVAIDIPDQIRKYAELRDAGYLTAQEFLEAKSDLLGKLRDLA